MCFKAIENTDEITLCPTYRKILPKVICGDHFIIIAHLSEKAQFSHHKPALKGHTYVKVGKTNNQITKCLLHQKKTKPKPNTYIKLSVKKIKIHMLAWKYYLFMQSWGPSHVYNHVHWSGLTKQAVLPAWEIWYNSAYRDNCWHVQKFIMAARQSPVFLAVVSLEYPEITRVNCRLSSQSCY